MNDEDIINAPPFPHYHHNSTCHSKPCEPFARDDCSVVSLAVDLSIDLDTLIEGISSTYLHSIELA
jgi:hypothetical protein